MRFCFGGGAGLACWGLETDRQHRRLSPTSVQSAEGEMHMQLGTGQGDGG